MTPIPTTIYLGNVHALATVGWLWLLPLLPLLAGLGAAFLAGRRPRAALVTALAGAGAAAVLAVMVLATLATLPAGTRTLRDPGPVLLAVGALRGDLGLLSDPVSAIVALVIAAGGTLVLLHELLSARAERRDGTTPALLALLVGALLLAVLGDSSPTILLGWGGSSLLVFLMVARSRRASAADASTFLVGRLIGDAALLVAAALTFWVSGGGWRDATYVAARTDQVSVVAESGGGAGFVMNTKGRREAESSVVPVVSGATTSPIDLADQMAVHEPNGDRPFARPILDRTVWGIPAVLLIGLLLAAAAAARAAQLPWMGLVPAMAAAPVPAVAFVMAAGMSSAAVYLLLRYSFLIVLAPAASTVTVIAGAATALLAPVCAIAQLDVRRLLGYVAAGQAGIAFAAAGLGAPGPALLQLIGLAAGLTCLWLLTAQATAALGDETAPGQGHDPLDGPAPGDPNDLRNTVGLASALPRTRRLHLLATLLVAGAPVSATYYATVAVAGTATAGSGFGTAVAVLCLAGTIAGAFAVLRAHRLLFRAGAPAAAAVELAPRARAVPWLLLATAVAAGVGLGLPAPGPSGPLAGWTAELLAPVAGLLTPASPGGSTLWVFRLVLIAGVVLAWWLAGRLYRDLETHGAALEGLGRSWRGLRRLLNEGFLLPRLQHELIAVPARDFARLVGWLESRVVGRETEPAPESAPPARARAGFDFVHLYIIAFTIGILLVLLLGLAAGVRKIPS